MAEGAALEMLCGFKAYRGFESPPLCHPIRGENMKPYFYKAKIISVYDGDTVTAVMDLGFNITNKIKIRLHGINAPEIRGKQRPEGLKSRDYLRSLILDKDVIIQTLKDKKGKYGRYIGIIHLEDKNINELLVESGHAEKKEY